MYIPPSFAMADQQTLHDLMTARPFATWVLHDGRELTANHLPLLFDAARGVLHGHVARANHVWQALPSNDSLLIFQGPQAYISPSWYPSKHEHGRAVPTWNYVVVQVHATADVITDRNWLRAHVTALSARHERSQTQPWQVSDAPADYIDTMLGNIVGIEFKIKGMTGKWKLGQNRSAIDQQGMMAALDEKTDSDAQQLAAMLRATMARTT